MKDLKTNSIKNIEHKMEFIEENTLRYKILENAKSFKTSWINLGQALYSVWKDKMYKEWGYLKFESYCSKEIGIRKDTALKLLRSYSFLEKEEPLYLRKEHTESNEPSNLPSYESVNVLRMASKKDLDVEDYKKIRSAVLENGKDVIEVKKDLTAIIKKREELEPEEAKQKQNIKLIKRFLSSIKSAKRDIQVLRLLPDNILKQADDLIEKIESAIN